MRNVRQTITKEWLEAEYLQAGRSIHEVSRMLGVGVNTIRRRLDELGVPVAVERQFGGRRGTGKFPQLRDRAWLEEALKTKTMKQIASELGTTNGNVSDYARRHGLRETHGSVRAGLGKAYPEGRHGALAANWRGGRMMTSGGHIYRHAPQHPMANLNGYVMEHRLVAEEKVGRPLGFGEVVHHKNGIKTDNRPENLEVMTVSEHRKEHMDAHLKLHQALERIKYLEGKLDAAQIQY